MENNSINLTYEDRIIEQYDTEIAEAEEYFNTLSFDPKYDGIIVFKYIKKIDVNIKINAIIFFIFPPKKVEKPLLNYIFSISILAPHASSFSCVFSYPLSTCSISVIVVVPSADRAAKIRHAPALRSVALTISP